MTSTSKPGPSKKSPERSRSTSPSPEDREAQTCPICQSSWNSTGPHRLVSLKCGHLFGLRCVKRWLLAKTAEHRSCPTCNSKADMNDIRVLYATKVVTVTDPESAVTKEAMSWVRVGFKVASDCFEKMHEKSEFSAPEEFFVGRDLSQRPSFITNSN